MENLENILLEMVENKFFESEKALEEELSRAVALEIVAKRATNKEVKTSIKNSTTAGRGSVVLKELMEEEYNFSVSSELNKGYAKNPYLETELPSKGSSVYKELLVYLDLQGYSTSPEDIADFIEVWDTFRKMKLAKGLVSSIGIPTSLWYLVSENISTGALKALVDMNSNDPYLGLFERDVKSGRLDKWDSAGVWGLGTVDIRNAWYTSGVGKNIHFFENIIRALLIILERYGRVDIVDVRILPEKWMGVKDIVKYLTFDHANGVGVEITTRLRMRLLSFTYPLRVSVIEQINALETVYHGGDDRGHGHASIIGTKSINWGKVNIPTYRLVKELVSKPKYQWHWYLGKNGVTIPKGLPLDQIGSPFDFNKKQLKFLIEMVNTNESSRGTIGHDEHYIIGLCNVLRLFGNDFQAIKKLIESVNIGSMLTDNTVISYIYDNKLSTEVKSLVLKDARYFEILSNYVVVREELGRQPVSYEEAKSIASAFRYDNIISVSTALEAARYALGQSLFEKVQKRQLKIVENSTIIKGQTTALPEAVEVVVGKYTARILDPLDPKGWFLGEITNCCQSLGGVGSTCAESGMQEPDKGFLVIEDGSEIIAQSWIWVSDGKLTLDSVESKGLSNTQLERVAGTIKEWCSKATLTIFVDEVFIGKTTYGVTKELRKVLQLDQNDCYNKIKNYSGYMDGKVQRRVY